MAAFKLWLEFEAVDPGNWDRENDFANINVDLDDGRHYGINVWTYRFVETAAEIERSENRNGDYLTPPDLLVMELTRSCIEAAITDLLKKGDLEHELNPSVLGSNKSK